MREYAGALLAAVLGGVAILVSFAGTWTVAAVPVFQGQPTPTTDIALSGADLAPLGSAAGWVVLAGVGGLIATRRLGRRIVGAVIALAATAAGTAGVIAALTYSALAGPAAADRGVGTGDETVVAGLAPWWMLALVGALAALAAGLLALARGPSWPGLGRRYERRGPAPAAAPAAQVSAADAWDALDRGEDPTLGGDAPERSG